MVKILIVLNTHCNSVFHFLFTINKSARLLARITACTHLSTTVVKLTFTHYYGFTFTHKT